MLEFLSSRETCADMCASGTRDILLRLEKYPHRMNFAKGILETRKQTYRHLRNLLKAIPIECPTVIELSPGNQIRVTLFDANHCVGASCFLIEDQNHAIFYTVREYMIQAPRLSSTRTNLRTVDLGRC